MIVPPCDGSGQHRAVSRAMRLLDLPCFVLSLGSADLVLVDCWHAFSLVASFAIWFVGANFVAFFRI
jgi:hypothetical protein